MDVFMVPIGHDRYELYCETNVTGESDSDEGQAGPIRSLVNRFREVLAAVERERQQEGRLQPVGDRSWPRRVRDWCMGWLAEAIAEQRLLWNLRRQEQVCLVYPSDLLVEHAQAIVRSSLRRDADRHFWWALVDAVLLVISGVLVLIPGPNLVAYYFAFRAVGHYLSWRGARKGLERVTWETRPSSDLAELRQAVALPAPQRALRVHDVAARLQLPHLARFFERMALRSA